MRNCFLFFVASILYTQSVHASGLCGESVENSGYASVLIIQKDKVEPEREFSVDRLFMHKYDTITVSNQEQYVDALYKFLCEEKFEPSKYNGFAKGGNYIAMFFSYEWTNISKYEENKYTETFSLAGDYLYGGDGEYRRKIDQTFRNRFHFSNSDLSIFGVP